MDYTRIGVAILPNDHLLLVRAAADRVALMEFRSGQWWAKTYRVTREVARVLGCDPVDIDYVFAGLPDDLADQTDPQPIGFYLTGESEPYFSWSPCDRCNCRLGGNRYDEVEVYDDESQVELSICEDCAALDC